MIVEAEVTIKGSRAALWTAIADIENASKIIRGIENIEVVEKPARGLVGLRWKETRMLFGKPATVEKRICDATDSEFYEAKAERSEEHTSELQSLRHLVCRLLLEK